MESTERDVVEKAKVFGRKILFDKENDALLACYLHVLRIILYS